MGSVAVSRRRGPARARISPWAQVMRHPWKRRRRPRRPRNRAAFVLFITAIAAGLYLAGVGIPELWLLFLIATWITFLRG